MAHDVDRLIDRRRLKRQLTFWRVFAVVALLAAGLAAAGRVGDVGGGDYVARMDVAGFIADDPRRTQGLAALADDGDARALIVRIDSPGGTVVGGEALYRSLRRVAETMPVVAVMGELGTSAAYMTALGCDHIVAREGTLTGSIGIILQTADLTGLLERLGIEPQTVKSGPLKAQPNPLERFTPEGREVAAEVVGEMHAMFVAMVEDRRGMAHAEALARADGRIYTGGQALANGLVDRLGGEAEAREWLEETRGVAASLPVRDLDFREPSRRVRDVLGEMVGKALFSERVRLDGLVSLWHPDL